MGSKDKERSKHLVLLVEPHWSQSTELRNLLKHKGLVTWWATDLSHAIEELSDFTVKDRPDVVMLEASPLSECFAALRAGLSSLESESDVSVVAMSEGGMATSPSRFYATNIAQLEAIIDSEVRVETVQY